MALCWVGYTQNQELKINKVKDALYNIEGDGGNVAAYVTGDGVVLVNDKFERDHAAIVAKVKSVTKKPIRYILTTHDQ